MAKSDSFFGKRRGSTSSLTFSVLNGKQITKERVTSVRNPKTQYQANQRMVMGAATKFQAALKGILNHSFEGIAYGDASLRYFAQHAMKGEGFLVGLEKGAFGFYPENYLISRGQLGSNNATCESGDGTLPLVGSASDIADFIEKNPRFQIGDQITVVAICNKVQRNDPKYTDPANFFVVVDRIVLNDTLSNLASVKTENEKFDLNLTAAIDNVTENASGHSDICALAVITSRMDEVNGQWLRSTEYMYADDAFGTAQLNTLNSNALASYMQAGKSMQSDRYLNQAQAPQGASEIYVSAKAALSPDFSNYGDDNVCILTVEDSEGVPHIVVDSNGKAYMVNSGDATILPSINYFQNRSVLSLTSVKLVETNLEFEDPIEDEQGFTLGSEIDLGATVKYVDVADFLFAQ